MIEMLALGPSRASAAIQHRQEQRVGCGSIARIGDQEISSVVECQDASGCCAGVVANACCIACCIECMLCTEAVGHI